MATVPVTRTWVAAEVVLASHFNTNIRDVLNYLLAPPIIEMRHAASQSINNSTWTSLSMDTEEYDSAGGHSTVSNTSRYTYVYPGWMSWSGAYAAAPNGTGLRYTRWAKTGTVQAASQMVANNVGGVEPTIVAARSKMIFGNVGDYVELQAFQASGGALGTSTTSEHQSGVSGFWESN